MSAKTIYDRLRKHGMTVAGACAMLAWDDKNFVEF